jgi:hypothetical protein
MYDYVLAKCTDLPLQVFKLTKFKSHSELVHAGLLLLLATLLLAGEKNFIEVPKTHPWQV